MGHPHVGTPLSHSGLFHTADPMLRKFAFPFTGRRMDAYPRVTRRNNSAMGIGMSPQRPAPATVDTRAAPLPFREFVTLIAALMALTALGIDSMLAALPAIGDSLAVENPNARQYVITAFLLGFAVPQIFYGPLADRFGRKAVLLPAMLLYVVMNLLAAISGSFVLLLAARVAAGMGAAGARVITVAIVRDSFAGPAMARVMSLVFLVFMMVPILAPAFGQAVLAFASWRGIFVSIALIVLAVTAWMWLRLPETLKPEDVRPLDPARVLQAFSTVLRNRKAAGYTLAVTAFTGALYSFVGSIQQIVFDVFHASGVITLVFAGIAGMMAISSLLNSRIVMLFGTRRISHTALLILIVFSLVHFGVALAGVESLVSFVVLQGLMMGCFGLCTANFSAMAMEDMGAIAGTASSFQGFVTTLVGALIGALVGQAFDGTTLPLCTGFVAATLVALGAVLYAERGRLFGRH